MRHSNSESNNSSTASMLTKLLGLFRSKSDNPVKPASTTKSHSKLHSKHRSASSSPTGAGAAPRRRFVRVVRDAEAQAPETIDDNPHVICRYSQGFLEEHYRKAPEELVNRPLPYTTSGHTILKKSQTDPTPSYEQHSPTVGKHATFKEFVEVIEFSKQDVVETSQHITHEARLHDDDVTSPDSDREPGFFLRHDSISETDADDQDAEAEVTMSGDVFEEVPGKVTGFDLDRMDGVMRNIFSSVANVVETSLEPPKTRRVELSELIQHCAEAGDTHEIVASGSTSRSQN